MTDADSEPAKKKIAESRDIPGGLPYLNAYGAFKKVLDGMIGAERPDKFSGDFMGTVLKVTGGSARPVPPVLKKMGFLTSDGTPTDLYSKFKSDSGRSAAALEGLKRAFPEIFRRNEFAHKAETDKVRDLVIEITGLNKSDPIVRSIVGTFQSIKDFVDLSKVREDDTGDSEIDREDRRGAPIGNRKKAGDGITLVYNINIVLPESTNASVFNSIFKSLRENLMDDGL